MVEAPATFGEYQLTYRSGDIVTPRIEAAEPLSLELHDFAHAIHTGEEPRSSSRLGLEIVRALEAAHASMSRTGEPIELRVSGAATARDHASMGLRIGPTTTHHRRGTGAREPLMAGAARTGSVAYITTSYPSLSHTFILREVLALRARGLEIHTISLRRTAGEHLLSKANRDASATTYAVRPPRWSEVLSVHVSALTRHPVSYLRTLREAQRLAREGWRGRLWQIFYFAEAVLVWRHCVRKRAGHIHAHHGSPAADVALLAAHFARGAGRGPATWSFTLHGPTEFWNVRWFRLAEKLRHAHAVVCISDFARSQAMALVAEEHWPKLHIVHCGLAAREHRATANVPALAAHILCVGRLVPEKGQAILLRALALLVNQGHAPTLTLVGSGQSQTALERLTGGWGSPAA